MSFGQLMQGDLLPTICNGETETWEVIATEATEDTVSLTLRLLKEKKRVEVPAMDPAEYRRQQMLKPHSKIRTRVPEGWLNV